jgi:hypothetical protein
MFYRSQELRELYPGLSGEEVDIKIGYLIGALRKKGYLETVNSTSPARYAITTFGLDALVKAGVTPRTPVPEILPRVKPPMIQAELNVEEGGKPKEKPKAEPPAHLPKIVGTVNEVKLGSIVVRTKGCNVELRAEAGIIGRLLSEDLLLTRIKLWLVSNKVVWVDKVG